MRVLGIDCGTEYTGYGIVELLGSQGVNHLENGLLIVGRQLLEHLRLAQEDILDFCVNPKYVHDMKWPDDYWPRLASPGSAAAWTKSLAVIRRDRKAMQRLAMNPRIDLFAKIPHGSGQTYMRELLLVGDHAGYHIAQIVDIRRALGNWK
jgi:hypothetical protein